MKKLLSLLAIAASMMLCGCSKAEEEDPEPPENKTEILNAECKDCHTLYRVKGQTWNGNASKIGFIQYAEGDENYSVYTVVDEQEDQPVVPFAVSTNGQILKWNCVGCKDDGKSCGRELQVEFTTDLIRVTVYDSVMPQTREHVLL